MITALSIRSFLLIDRLDLDCSSGVTALTGETGAGKSIILDALGLLMGGQAHRKLVRHGCEEASVSAQFSVPGDHEVWKILSDAGLSHDVNECLTLRRVLHITRPSRAFLNDQPISASALSDIGCALIDIHGQHAASGLMRPSSHGKILDGFAGNHEAVADCGKAWAFWKEAQEILAQLKAKAEESKAQIEWSQQAIEELKALAPEKGEAKLLSDRRAILMQSEKLTDTIADTLSCLNRADVEEALAQAARSAERTVRLLGEGGDTIQIQAKEAAEAVERALIEFIEAQSVIGDLSQTISHDGAKLSEVENRLFALRTAGRKYEHDPDHLDELLAHHLSKDADNADLELEINIAAQTEKSAQSAWQDAADRLSERRRKAAESLPIRMARELAGLQMGRVSFRATLEPISPEGCGAKGQETVTFEVETNPGTGFGPLHSIASGGELARFSLALQCVLQETGSAGTLIFDEADQGVGGAVAAAIGQRLSDLSQHSQVFAITHSPQVASFANRQWRVRKSDDANGSVSTQLSVLDEGERLEEIARMLSGSSVTDEARAAASKLLEAA